MKLHNYVKNSTSLMDMAVADVATLVCIAWALLITFVPKFQGSAGDLILGWISPVVLAVIDLYAHHVCPWNSLVKPQYRNDNKRGKRND